MVLTLQVQDLYQKKIISLVQAVSMVKSDMTIGVAMAASEPQGLLAQLGSLRNEVENVRVFSALLLKEYSFFNNPAMKGHFLLESWFYGPSERKFHEYETVSLIPSHGRDWGWRKALYDPPDIFWGSAAPMDRHGYFTLALGVGYEKSLLKSAKTVVLEVNPNLPRIYGDTQVHLSEVDFLVEHRAPLPEIPASEPTAAEMAIGQFIAELIDDGATIQLGIGGIPNAIARCLREKKDLGVHTEMFTDGMVDLVNQGVITGRKKSLWPGKLVGNFALGTSKLYRFLDENLAVEFQQGKITNDPRVLAKNSKMTSVNTALQIDLTGQVVSESIGNLQYSGTGGQVDTAIGAQMSPGGKSIIAVRSTARGGQISTILAQLPLGAKVTLGRADVDNVVTEYGVAHLKARCVRERVNSLIAIAHPDFRSQLRQEAAKLKLW
jgi:acyl-CoA hydrolase